MTIVNGHFSTLAPPGSWVIGFAPAPSLWATMDQYLSQTVNGDGGGTWAPITPIYIGGQGLQCPSGGTWHINPGGNLQIDAGGNLVIFGNAEISTGSFLVQGGASVQWQSGTSATFAGASLTLQSGAVVNAQSNSNFIWFAGSSLILESGSSSTIYAGANIDWNITSGVLQITPTNGLAVNGQTVRILDGTNPTFATARTQKLLQPINVLTNVPGAQSEGSFWYDNGVSEPAGVHYWMFTKMVHAARLNQLQISVNIPSAHSPSAAATLKVYASDNQGNTTLIASASAPTGVGGVQTVTMNLTASGNHYNNDDTLQYYLVIQAETGGQVLNWYPPIITFDQITYLGQGNV